MNLSRVFEKYLVHSFFALDSRERDVTVMYYSIEKSRK